MINSIRDMQRRLRRLGYSVYVTGEHDERSVRCLKAFQRDLKLNPSGEFDSDSQQRLIRCVPMIS